MLGRESRPLDPGRRRAEHGTVVVVVAFNVVAGEVVVVDIAAGGFVVGRFVVGGVRWNWFVKVG